MSDSRAPAQGPSNFIQDQEQFHLPHGFWSDIGQTMYPTLPYEGVSLRIGFGVRISQPRSGTAEAGPAFIAEVGPAAVAIKKCHMQDEFQRELAILIQRLRNEAADLKSISASSTDRPASFERLAARLNDLADQVERLMRGRMSIALH